MSVDRTAYRDAMARLGAAVNVITTAGQAGRCGYTATAVCSVTDDPATMLVCLNRSSAMHAVFAANGVLCVNVLSGSQQELSLRFSGQTGVPMQERFGDDQWTTLESGAPAHLEAQCLIDCRISSIHEIGTHSVFYCEVLGLRLSGSTDSLIYWGRQYHRLAGVVARPIPEAGDRAQRGA